MIELLAGAVIAAVSYAAGRLVGKRERTAKVQAVCPCQHHIGDHENMTGRCRAQIKRKILHSGIHVQDEWVTCTCRNYAGPELISSFTLRPVTMRSTTEENS